MPFDPSVDPCFFLDIVSQGIACFSFISNPRSRLHSASNGTLIDRLLREGGEVRGRDRDRERGEEGERERERREGGRERGLEGGRDRGG